MTTWIAKHCGCRQESCMGKKRERFCELHGNLFESQATIESRSRRWHPKRSSEPKRDWTDARAKVQEEGCCRICKRSDRKLEAAHIMGREHDEPRTGSKVLYVHPDRIVPLCGPFPEGCHGDFDHRRINLVHVLRIEEQLRAVRDADGIAAAWRHLAPVEFRAELVQPQIAEGVR